MREPVLARTRIAIPADEVEVAGEGINEERFAPVSAKYIRFTVAATNNGSEPCIDELEIYSTAAEKTPAANVALLDAGAKAASSGDLSGFAIHKLQHVQPPRLPGIP